MCRKAFSLLIGEFSFVFDPKTCQYRFPFSKIIDQSGLFPQYENPNLSTMGYFSITRDDPIREIKSIYDYKREEVRLHGRVLPHCR